MVEIKARGKGTRWKDASQLKMLRKETFSFSGDNDSRLKKIELEKETL